MSPLIRQIRSIYSYMTTQTQNEQIDAADVWRAIGRLEGDTASLLEGQRNIREEVREVRAWMIRLFYAIIGMGGAIVVMLIATLIAAFQR